MSFILLFSRKNMLFMIIIIFFANLKVFNSSQCDENDDLNSKTCFNDIIKFDNKKYRAVKCA